MHSTALIAALATCLRFVAAAELGAVASMENIAARDASSVASCPHNSVADNGACVDVVSDPANCGFVGHRCPRPIWSQATCSVGACDFECTKGYRRDGAGCDVDEAAREAAIVAKPEPPKRHANAKKTYTLCPTGETACPIAANLGRAVSKPAQVELSARLIPSAGYECMDTVRTLESCGGCASTGEGSDCTQIAHANGVGCEDGQCVVFTCGPGFRPSLNQSTCVKVSSHGRRKRNLRRA